MLLHKLQKIVPIKSIFNKKSKQKKNNHFINLILKRALMEAEVIFHQHQLKYQKKNKHKEEQV